MRIYELHNYTMPGLVNWPGHRELVLMQNLSRNENGYIQRASRQRADLQERPLFLRR
jgi:hypothetical protein